MCEVCLVQPADLRNTVRLAKLDELGLGVHTNKAIKLMFLQKSYQATVRDTLAR